MLLKAAALLREKVPDVQLLIVGSGSSPYMKSLKAEASRLKLPVVFAGRISHRSIHRAYGAADCFVCPSQQHEAFGLVNVEAMATGIPVIASDIGGIGEIVKHKHNGYLVRKYTRPEEFARYLIRLARSRSLQAELSHNARKTAVRHFGWKQTAKALSALYGRFR
ncbi:glycosyltransferase family 4 protein [Paenibacillus sp. CC-CFT747]|nr:glycosyltransferase family 4 protein [Paenibacillus sp. CC-CFT747]